MPWAKRSLEQMIADIQRMDRRQLQHELTHFQACFKFDFTTEFLEQVSIERLRHIMLAAMLYTRPRRRPGHKSTVHT